MMTAVAGAVPWVLVSMLAAPAMSSPLPSNSTHTPSGRQTTPGARSSHRRTATCAAPSALNSRTRSPSPIPRAAASAGCMSSAWLALRRISAMLLPCEWVRWGDFGVMSCKG